MIAVRHGQVWVVDALDALPDRARQPRTPASEPVRAQVPCAPGAGPAPALRWVSARLVCQTASGGSFLAMAGAQWVPHAGGDVRIRVAATRDAPGHITPETAHLIAQGAASQPPSTPGKLTVSWGRLHLVDWKPREWVRCGALLMRAVWCAPEDLEAFSPPPPSSAPLPPPPPPSR